MNPLTPLELGMSERGSYRVIGNSGKWVIEKQMANGNQQFGQAKNDTDWDVSLKSFRTWDEAGGTPTGDRELWSMSN